MWGVFSTREVRRLPQFEVHVMPCGDDGAPDEAHAFDGDCPCQAAIEVCLSGKILVIHNDAA